MSAGSRATVWITMNIQSVKSHALVSMYFDGAGGRSTLTPRNKRKQSVPLHSFSSNQSHTNNENNNMYSFIHSQHVQISPRKTNHKTSPARDLQPLYHFCHSASPFSSPYIAM